MIDYAEHAAAARDLQEATTPGMECFCVHTGSIDPGSEFFKKILRVVVVRGNCLLATCSVFMPL